MELSFWGQIGVLIGAFLGYVNYRVIMAILEPRLRKLDKSQTAEERNDFERRIVLLRRIFLVLEIGILGAIGYFLGKLFGG